MQPNFDSMESKTIVLNKMKLNSNLNDGDLPTGKEGNVLTKQKLKRLKSVNFKPPPAFTLCVGCNLCKHTEGVS